MTDAHDPVALIHDALRRIQRQDVPAWAVVVDAIDAAAAGVYEHHGLVAFPHQPARLLLPVTAIPPDIAGASDAD